MTNNEKKNANDMRIAFTVQVSELIDVLSAYECKMELLGDFDEARRVRGAVFFAKQKLHRYYYNGDYQDLEAS